MQENKTRNSSVELFRIIATFLVLIVHFNGNFYVGMLPDFGGFTTFYISQDIIESFSIVCVNCFLVITGWYGMTFKWYHVLTIWSILAWIYVSLFVLNYFWTGSFSIFGLIKSCVAIVNENYYVQCYLMLLFLCPILNLFIKKYGRAILPYSLAFWAIEIIFDWFFQNKCLGFGRGFELTHFILMYFLGQTAYLYNNEIQKYYKTKYCIGTFILGALLISVMYLFIPYKFCFVYSNPINIVMAFSLFFIFERETFYNNLINWIGQSTLAVYILHAAPPIYNILREWDLYLLGNFSYPIYLCLIVVTILIVFISAVLYDKIRIWVMQPVITKFSNWLYKRTEKYSIIKINIDGNV